ncbi:MAG: hypothetical protein OXG81_13995 [Acidobacteria bacterium]|nr:hypothetical protein [Acidobacteriota bacterium]
MREVLAGRAKSGRSRREAAGLGEGGKMKTPKPAHLAYLAVLLALAVPAAGIAYVMPTDESMVDRSPLIVFGEVLNVRPGLEGAGPTTEYLFRIEEVLKGFLGGGAIEVRQSDWVVPWRADLPPPRRPPTLAEGDRVLLFLEDEDSGTHEAVKYSLGRFREIERDGRPQFFAGAIPAGENWRGTWQAPPGRPAAAFRDASRFRRWIVDRVAGIERAADYFWSEPVAAPSADRPGAAQTSELLASDNAARTSSCSGDTCLLQGGRFRVKAWYPSGGSSRPAGAVGAALGGSAGLFTSDSGSSELLVRVVNRCSTTGYWEVYAGAASDADFRIAIRDTRSNELEWFQVQAGSALAAFGVLSCASGDAGTATGGPDMDSGSRCSGVTCLLQMGAFRVKTWYSRAGAPNRPAPTVAVNLGESAGLFTSDSGHSELLLRVVNTCRATGHWTVYAGAASDADFRIAIRDTRSNELKWSRVSTGRSVADAEAFPCLGGDLSISERAALAALYEATSGPNWIDDTNWLTDRPLDEWHGVTTDESGNVVRLDLSGNFLVGRIPPELGGLGHLQRLDLSSNVLLQGRLPSEFFDLTDLEYLTLSWTGLGGPLPPAIGRLRSLESLNWQGSGLTGPIPGELGKLINLRFVYLAANYLSGPLPPELGNLANLRVLDLTWNEHTGPVPAELGRLSWLEAAFLDRNHFTGSIPPELGDLTNLHMLSLEKNELSGAIPGTLRSLSRLSSLELGGNGFTGSIPSWLSTLGELRRLHLEDNALSGGLPDEFGSLTNLTDLRVGANPALSGPVPVSLTRLDNLASFKAGGTRLCAPPDPELLDWLSRIPIQRLARCEPAQAYLTQSVQSREFPVPLVGGRPALLRVFLAQENGDGARMPEVRATFYLDDARIHRVDIPASSARVPAAIDEGSLTGSANADVPGSVIRPGLEWFIEIDPGGRAGAGIRRRLPERGRMVVDVVELPDFRLTVIPFLYEFRPDRTILEITEEMAAAPDKHPVLADTLALLPIGELELNLHAPVLTSTDDGFGVLQETEMIRLMEGRPGAYYMGMLTPVRLGLLGVARLPGWSSFSQPLSRTVAHELGHNLALAHGPCGGAAGPDPLYPDPTGMIGAWGYDRDSESLVSPYTPDLMTYCRNHWISDYHLANALRHRVKSESVGTTGAMARFGEVNGPDARSVRRRSLLVSGGLDAGGSPFLEPAVIADALTVPSTAGARLRVEGDDGRRELGVLAAVRHAGTAGPGRRALRLRLLDPRELGGSLGRNQSSWRRRNGHPQPGHRPATDHSARFGDRRGAGHPAPTGGRGARSRWRPQP